MLKTKIITAQKAVQFHAEMMDLYQRYYKVDPEHFLNRFAINDYYAFYFEGKYLFGFTGVRFKKITTKYGTATTLYLGQSIVTTDYRGHALVTRTAMKMVLKSLIQNPFRPIYVWCDALTYKAYLAFTKATIDCYPNYKTTTPKKIQSIIHELGTQYYGHLFSSKSGTVQKTQKVVKDPDAQIYKLDLQNPVIRFFQNANPNHNKGHGLITITPVSLRNVYFCLHRCIKKKFRKKSSYTWVFKTS